MERLTPRQREIVELRCGPNELTYEGAAAAMGIARHTVRSQCSDILLRLGVRSFNGVCREYGRRLDDPDALRPERV